jgi:hypothetical protein
MYGNNSNGDCQGTWSSPSYAPTLYQEEKGLIYHGQYLSQSYILEKEH